MNRQIIITASILGLLGVIAGAFAAHGLKLYLSPQQLEIWHTGVQYQFYHVFALLFLSTQVKFDSKLIKLTYYFFFIGIIFFSGSLYLLACRELIGWNLLWLGPITPIGGVLFIAGWATLVLAAFRNR